jgi:hypothetical protein
MEINDLRKSVLRTVWEGFLEVYISILDTSASDAR